MSYALVLISTLLIVSFVFDYSVSHHFERVFGSDVRRPETSRFLQMSRPFIDAVRLSLIYAALGSGLIALIFSYFVSNYFVAPIQQLIEVTKKNCGW